MGVWLVVAALLVLAFGFFLVARRKRPASGQRPDAGRPAQSGPATEFHAVSIKFTSSACDAAKAMEGKRFLSSAAPRLPLPDCNVLECKCRFIHHKDRRDGEDRRDPYARGLGATGAYKKDQRSGEDRRKSDG